jgi:hypothetical protein
MLRKIDISHRTIIFTVLFLWGYGFCIIFTHYNPAFYRIFVNDDNESDCCLFEKIKIKRGLAVLITYILVIGVLGGTIALIAPALAQQTTNFINAFPSYLQILE